MSRETDLAMKKLARWLGYAAPPIGLCLLTIVIVGGARAIAEYCDAKWWSHVVSGIDAGSDRFQFWRIFSLVPATFSALYGFVRGSYRNPAFQSEYASWLLHSPWNWPDALPWGAVLPVWQDIVFLGVLTLTAVGHPAFPLFLPALLAVAGYTAALSWGVLRAAPGRDMYVPAITLCGAIHWWDQAAICVPFVLATLFSVCQSMSRVLSEFRDWAENNVSVDISIPLRVRQQWPLGWPHAGISPAPLGTLVTWRDALSCGLLTLAMFWAPAVPEFRQPDASEVRLTIGALGGMFGFMRLLAYHLGCASPATRWSMVVRARPISLKYDQVFVPIIAILAASGASPFLVARLQLTGVQQVGLATAGLLILALKLPPSLEQWRLTGDVQLTAATSRSSSRRRNMAKR